MFLSLDYTEQEGHFENQCAASQYFYEHIYARKSNKRNKKGHKGYFKTLKCLYLSDSKLTFLIPAT